MVRQARWSMPEGQLAQSRDHHSTEVHTYVVVVRRSMVASQAPLLSVHAAGSLASTEREPERMQQALLRFVKLLRGV